MTAVSFELLISVFFLRPVCCVCVSEGHSDRAMALISVSIREVHFRLFKGLIFVSIAIAFVLSRPFLSALAVAFVL